MRLSIIRMVLGLGLIVGLGACSTVEQKGGGADPSPMAGAEPKALGSMTELSKEMPVSELVGLYGEPDEKTKIEREGLIFERWIYEEPFESRVDMVASRMEEVPYMDPLTGESKTIQEPVFTQEMKHYDLKTDILVFDGKVIEWKQSAKLVRSLE